MVAMFKLIVSLKFGMGLALIKSYLCCERQPKPQAASRATGIEYHYLALCR